MSGRRWISRPGRGVRSESEIRQQTGRVKGLRAWGPEVVGGVCLRWEVRGAQGRLVGVLSGLFFLSSTGTDTSVLSTSNLKRSPSDRRALSRPITTSKGLPSIWRTWMATVPSISCSISGWGKWGFSLAILPSNFVVKPGGGNRWPELRTVTRKGAPKTSKRAKALLSARIPSIRLPQSASSVTNPNLYGWWSMTLRGAESEFYSKAI